MMKPFSEQTPMMQQWSNCKKQAKEALLFFRLGDFFEAFYEDAEILANTLQLTLTQRQGIPMCGVPVHAHENYLDKLLQKGFKVAIADQVQSLCQGKGLMTRKITRIVSPATLFSSSLLEEKRNNFFVSLYEKDSVFGLILLDLSTSEFRFLQLEEKNKLLDELFRLSPAELLVSHSFQKKYSFFLEELSYSFPFLLTVKEDTYFDSSFTKELSLDLSFLQKFPSAFLAAVALFYYLEKEMRLSLSSIKKGEKEELSSYMSIDRTSLENLDILPREKKDFSLLGLLDKTKTPMGGRLLATWVKRPLFNLKAIEKRQQSIEELLNTPSLLLKLQKELKNIRDLPRILAKIENHYASAKDLVCLKSSLQKIPCLEEALEKRHSSLLKEHKKNLLPLPELVALLDRALLENPAHRLSEGEVFKEGYSKELDELRKIGRKSKEWIANYQQTLRQEFGIKTLKVGYTKAFGYYIEVSQGQIDKVPSSFIRRQTLTSAERYVTEELKSFEYQVLSAEGKIRGLETLLFEELKKKVLCFLTSITSTALSVSHIDALSSLAQVALEYGYTKPEVNLSYDLQILQGRHPILERALFHKDFIANDTIFSCSDSSMYIITGPNMAGKSTYIRQVALLVILAQMGSFIPAKSAKIGLVDQVFSRVGAFDDIAKGESTFMVEMKQTAHILQEATSSSLIILDEIGRGTSTYDGISIAWAVAEFLLTEEKKKAKTLFATHYWELTELEKLFLGVKNYQVAVKETAKGIVFLHKILPGGTDKSYGIHVAKLAGLPEKMLEIAAKRLKMFEKRKKKEPPIQGTLFPLVEKEICILCEKIKKLQVDQMSPLSALQTLYEIQKG